MPLITPHFSTTELNREGVPLTAAQTANQYKTAVLLENVREILGVPLDKVSGFRTPQHNEDVPGSSETSQHMTASASDFTPRGITLYQAAGLLTVAERRGFLKPFGQLIYYPYTTGHIHISLPNAGKYGEKLVKTVTGYAYFDLNTFPGASAPGSPSAPVPPSAPSQFSVDPKLLLLGVALFGLAVARRWI